MTIAQGVLISANLDEREFRQSLRDWFEANPAPQQPKNAIVGAGWSPEYVSAQRQWQKSMAEAGLAGLAWPREYGGQGASPMRQLVFHEEHQRAGGQGGEPFFVGISHAGPTIITKGTEWQRSAWLPGILNGDLLFAQCFSEPGAGSDLAAVSTRAVVDGEDLVITGQKRWNTHAQHADLCELLVRTDPADRYGGLTYLVADMRSPGVTVRAITTITGEREFAEVFFDDVRVPLANTLGQIGEGWSVATTTLSFERSTAFAATIIGLQRRVAQLADAHRGDPVLSARVAELADDVFAARSLLYKSISEQEQNSTPGPASSALKLIATELNFVINRFAALADPTELKSYLESFGLRIGGGTSEIQRNVLAERVLGLPKEPRR
jgi:alkylation response protein AidB-like acyl-CoA dehydrogenase